MTKIKEKDVYQLCKKISKELPKNIKEYVGIDYATNSSKESAIALVRTSNLKKLFFNADNYSFDDEVDSLILGFDFTTNSFCFGNLFTDMNYRKRKRLVFKPEAVTALIKAMNIFNEEINYFMSKK